MNMANALIFILLMGNLSNGKGVRKGSRNGSNLLLAFALLDRSRVDMTYRSHDARHQNIACEVVLSYGYIMENCQ